MDMDYSKVDDKLTVPFPRGSIMTLAEFGEEYLYIIELYPTINRTDRTTSLAPTQADMIANRAGILQYIQSAQPSGNAAPTNVLAVMTALPYQLAYDAWCRKYWGIDALGHANSPLPASVTVNPNGSVLAAPDKNNPAFFTIAQ